MSTYCRITGKSRGLPKPHYFPLLPPISPADAKRLCRITGKSYGLPTHHYIPVVTALARKRKIRCQVTSKSDGQQAHHFQPILTEATKHSLLKSFRYVVPVLEANTELLELLAAKVDGAPNAKFVYPVHERQYGLVLPAQLEAAVRDGDVRDLMLAKDADKLVLKLRKGASIEVDIRDAALGQWDLFEGEGPNQDIVVRRKKQRRGTDANDWRCKIFEDKEKEADSEEERITQIRSKRPAKGRHGAKASPVVCSWKNVSADGVIVSGDVDEKVRNSILEAFGKHNLADFVSASNASGKPMAQSLPAPLKIDAESVDLCHSLPGLVQQPVLLTDGVIGFRVASVLTPFQPNMAQVDVAIDDALKKLNENKVPLKKALAKQSACLKKRASMLVHPDEIPAAVAGIAHVMERGAGIAKHKFEQGMKLTLEDAEKYVPGQFVSTGKGEVFVPGNVIETATGPQFVPGFAVFAEEGDPKFIPGFIVKEDPNDPVGTFVAGQLVLTRDGEKFVQGQPVVTKDGSRFMPGQTVFTPDGIKFVPGQVVEDPKVNSGFRFVPGQTTMTNEGAQFVPGQFVETSSGMAVFQPGQSVLNENSNWEFVQGQNFKGDDGDLVFVPGKEILNEDGYHQFVPGRVLLNENQTEVFVPGVTITDESGKLKFVPGMELETDDGLVFVEGILAELDDNTHSFLIGKVSSMDEADGIQFERAISPEGAILHDIIPHMGLSISSINKPDADDTVVFGHMVQSSQGIEFFPGEAVGLPAGKVIPGRLVKDDETQFIPGTMIDGKFTPGQFVTTDTEEKFIPGQVIDTNAGPKFVPGQVLHTSSGSKFVPGQTMETENGPKFIPGQIIDTKSGPTFIPGQVISTDEEGSRFVPGQVVDTMEGPRFVPGRVVETGEGVAFIPGQIVETEDGLRFVAPDLEDDPEGGYQFTLQGFEVAQEELKMIQRNTVPSACLAGQLAIDWKMLQQLSDAGMAVGRQIPVDIPDVDIKSSHIAEVACTIVNNLNIDSSYSIPMNHILSNILQIAQSNVPLPEEELAKDENLKQLMNLAGQFGQNLDSPEFLNTLGNAVENIIKADLDHKQQSINTLHAVTVDLATKVREKQIGKVLPAPAVQMARKMANKMNLDGSSSIKMSHILSNIQQLKDLNVAVLDEEITDKSLQDFFNVALEGGDNIGDEEYIQALGKALENAIKVDVDNPAQNIEMLETITNKLASKVRAKKSKKILSVPIIEMACQVTSKLGLDPKHSSKIGHILSNMQQAKHSNGLVLKDIKDEDSKRLLNAAIECTGGNDDLLQSLGNVLEHIMGQHEDKLQILDSLHTFSTNVAENIRADEPEELSPSLAVVESAGKIAAKLEVGGLESIKINDILLNLQEIKKSNVPIAMKNNCDKNLKKLLTLVSDSTAEPSSVESVQAFAAALEETLKADPEKLTTIGTLHTLTSNMADDIRQQNLSENLPVPVVEFICKMIEDFDIDPICSKKIGKILTNLQQIRQAKMPSPNGKIKDKNLKNLLHFVSNLDAKKSNLEIYEDLSEALMGIIKVDSNKERTINTLLALSDDLALKARAEKISVHPAAAAEAAHQVAKKLKVGSIESMKIKNILSNLQQMQAFNIPSKEIKNEDLKVLLKCAADEGGCQSSQEFFEKLASALEDIALASPESAAQTINTLHELTEKLQTDAKEKELDQTLSLNVVENACQLARNLNLDPAQSIKMGQILSNLQQMNKLEPANSMRAKVKDENLKTLLDLAAICEAEGLDTLQSLEKALEKTIKIDPDRKINVIDSLHNATTKLASNKHKKLKNRHVADMVCQISQKFKVDEPTAKKISKILTNMQNIKQSNVTIIQNVEDENLKNLLNLAAKFEEGKGDAEILQSLGNALEAAIKTDVTHKLKTIDDLHSLTSDFMDKTYHEQTSNVSLIIPQMASAVADELNVDHLHSIKISKIFENLQQIQKSGLNVPLEEIKDEKLKSVLQAVSCGPQENETWLQNVSKILKDVVKQDLIHKFETINNLHNATKELASKAQGKLQSEVLTLQVAEKASKMAKKLQLNPSNFLKVGAIVQNLQQIKKGKISSNNEKVKDKNLKILLKIANEFRDETNPEFVEAVSNTLEKMICQNLDHKQQTINTLHSLTADLASSVCAQQLNTMASLPIAEMASQISDNVNANLESSVKINDILSSIHKIKLLRSNIPHDEITNENLQLLLSVAAENGEHFEDVEYLQSICDTLENIIKVDLDHKEQNINALHLSAVNLATKLQAKQSSTTLPLPVLEVACKVAEKLNIDPSYAIKLSSILSNAQKMEKSDIADLKDETGDETMKSLLTIALECVQKSDNNFVDSLENNLENIIQSALDNNQQTINALHSMTVKLTSKVRDKQATKVVSVPFFEKATKVASDLNISPTYVVKMSNILANLQQIKQSNVAIFNDEIVDKNLKKLLNVVSGSENNKSEEQLAQILGDALESVLREDPSHKLQHIDVLQALTADLASDIANKQVSQTQSSPIAEVACKVASKLNVGPSHSIKMSHIISNLKQIKESHVAILDEITDPNLKKLVDIAMEVTSDRDQEKLFEALGNALEDVICVDLDHKLQTIDDLHLMTANLASNVSKKQSSKTLPLPVIEMACSVASKLDIDPSYSVKMGHILSNLQQIKQSNVPVITADISDDNLKTLINIAMDCCDDDEDSGVQFLQKIGDALQMSIGQDAENKLQSINTLYLLTTELSSKIHNAEMGKIVSLPIIEMACSVASDLNIDPSYTIKLSQILSNLKQITESKGQVLKETIPNETLRQILATVAEFENCKETEVLQRLGNALKQTINVDLHNKLQTIDNLYEASDSAVTNLLHQRSKSLPSPTVVKHACKVAENLKLETSSSVPISFIVWNLQQLNSASLGEVLKTETGDENLNCLIRNALKFGEKRDASFVKGICDALQKIVKGDDNQKKQIIKTLCSLTTNLSARVSNDNMDTCSPESKMSEAVVRKCKLDASNAVLIENVLNNLQKIQNSSIPHIFKNGVKDENLQKVLQLVSNCEKSPEKSETLASLSEGLQQVLNENVDDKQKLLTMLHATTTSLVTNIPESSSSSLPSAFVAKLSESVTKKLKVDPACAVLVEHILQNVKQIKKSDLKDILNNGIKDESIGAILKTALENHADDVKAAELLSEAICNSVKGTREQKEEKLNYLYTVINNSVGKSDGKVDIPPTIIEAATPLINDLQLSPSNSIQVVQILSNLQKVMRSDLPQILSEGASDENLQMVLDLVGDCNDPQNGDLQQMKMMSNAIKNILEKDANISQKISIIHATSTDLASSIRGEDQSPLAPLMAQISQSVVKSMKVDSTCVPVVEQILQSIQKIKKDDVKKILNNGIRDKNLTAILKEVLNCESDGKDSVKVLGDILVKSIKGSTEEKKQKLATLYSSINNMQAKHDLWTCEKNSAPTLVAEVTEVSASLINNLDLNPTESIQVVQILDNLQKIKKSNLPSVLQKGAIDKNIQAVLTLASAGSEFQDEKLQLQSSGGLLESIIVNSPENRSHIISILHATAADVASAIQEQSKPCDPLVAKLSENLAEKLNINPNYAVLIKNVIQGIQQIEKSNIPQILSNGLKNEQLRDILKVVQDNIADDAETARVLSDVLHKTIKGTSEQKENLINLLYSSTVNLKDQATLDPNVTEIAAPLIAKLDLNPSSTRLMMNTISNLQKLRKSDISNLLKSGVADENVQMVLEALHTVNEKQTEPEQFKAMGTFLENVISRDPKCKLETLNLLHAITSDLVISVPIHSKNISSAEMAKFSEAVAEKMNLDPTRVILIEHIVQNVQRIPKQTIQTILGEDKVDENLKNILEVALKCDGSDSNSLQQLGEAILHIMKGTPEEKEQKLNSLYAKTCDLELNSSSNVSSSKIAEVVSPLVAKLGLNPSNSSLLVETFSNLQKIQKSNLNTLLQKGNVDENVQIVLKLISPNTDQMSINDQLQSIGNHMEEIINQNPEQKLSTIATLHATAAKLASNIPENLGNTSFSVIKLSEDIAKKMELNPTSTVLVKQILQNLQQVDKVDLNNILKKGVSNQNLKELLKACIHCDLSDEKSIPIISKSFEKLTKGVTGDKESTINELYTSVCDVLSSINSSNSNHIPLVVEIATPVIAKLNLSPSVSAPVIEILTNLQKIEKSSLVHQLQKGCMDENIQVLLDLASAIDKNKNRVEQVQGTCDILEKVLGKNPEQQSKIVNVLHAVTEDLVSNIASKTLDSKIEEAVVDTVKEMNLHPSMSIVIRQVVDGMQKFKKSDLQNILQQGNVSETMQDLIKTALKCDSNESDEEVAEKLVLTLQKSIKGNAVQKEKEINSLYTQLINAQTDLNQSAENKTPDLSNSAMKLTQRLHLPASNSAILGHLVSNLQQIKKSDLQNILQQGEQDENILMIADIISGNDNVASNAKLQRLIEQGLEENICGTLEDKLKIINALHAASVNIVSDKVRHNVNNLPPPSISKIAGDFTKKMKLSRTNAQLVGPILWNIQKLSKTYIENILNEGTVDADLQDLIKAVAHCSDGNKVTQALTNALQTIIKRHPNHEEETVNHLYSSVINLLTESAPEKSDQIPAQVMDVASNLSEKLHLNTSSSPLIASIFCNIQKLKELPIQSIVQKGELGANTKTVLNLVLECNGCANEEEMLKVFEEITMNAVDGDQEQKIKSLNLLHSTTADMISNLQQEQIKNIPTSLTGQIAHTVAKKIDVDASNVPLIENILWNLQQLCQNNSKDIREYGPIDESLQILLEDGLHYSDKASDQITRVLAESLQKVIGAVDKEDKLNRLYSSALNLVTNIQQKQLNAVCVPKKSKVARALAINLDMTPDKTQLIEQVLDNLDQIVELNTAGELECVKLDDCVKQILKLNSDLNDIEIKNLPERLEKLLKEEICGDQQEKLDKLTTLHAITSNVIAQVKQKQFINTPPAEVTQKAQDVTRKLNLDPSNSVLIERAIWNLEQLTPADVKSILKKGVPNDSLKALLKVLAEENEDCGDMTLALGTAMQKLIKGTPDQKELKLQELYSSAFLLVSEAKKGYFDESADVSTEIVIPLAKRLQLDLPTSSLIENMLINLKKLRKSALPKILQKGAVDENVQMVLNLLTACKDDDKELNQIKLMSTALETLLANNPEHKASMIGKLHATSLDLLPLMPCEEAMKKPQALVANVSKAVVKKLNINDSKTILVEKLLTNLQDIKKSASNLHTDDVADEDFKKLLQVVVDMPSNSSPEKVAQALGNALLTIKGTREQKEDQINTLYAKSIDLLSSLPDQTISHSIQSDIAEVVNSLTKDHKLGSADMVLLKQIVSNALTIKKSRLPNVLKKGVLDEKLQPIIDLVIKSEKNEGKMEELEAIGAALQSIINEKPDKKQLLLNSIHMAAAELVNYLQKGPSQSSVTPPQIAEIGQNIAGKMKLDASHAALVSQTLCNLQQASKVDLNNILNEGILNDTSKKLIHSVLQTGDCKTDAEVAAVLRLAYEQAIQGKESEKLDKINSLYSLSVNLLDDTNKKAGPNILPQAVLEVADTFIRKLKIDPGHATLIGHCLSNLKKIKQSNVSIPVEKGVKNDCIKVIEDLLDSCDKNLSETEMLQSFSSGLEKAIQGNKKQTLKILNKLHATSENLLASIHGQENEDVIPAIVAKSAANLTEKLKLDPSTAKLVQHVMRNIQKLNGTDIKNALHSRVVDHNLEVLLDAALEVGDSKNITEITKKLGQKLQTIVKGTDEEKKQKVHELYSASVNLGIPSPAQPTSNTLPEAAMQVADKVVQKLKMDSWHAKLIGHVLCNLKDIQQKGISDSEKGALDENLQKIIDLAVEFKVCSEQDMLPAFGAALEKTIRGDADWKLQSLNQLHAATVALLSESHRQQVLNNPPPLVAETSSTVAKKLHLVRSSSVLLGHLLWNLQQIRKVDLQRIVQRGVTDDSLQTLLKVALENVDKESGELTQTLGDTLCKLLNNNKNQDQKIDSLYASTINLLTNLNNGNMGEISAVSEAAAKIAHKLNINESYSEKVGHILSNLQQINRANVALFSEKDTDESLKVLLSLALDHGCEKDGRPALEQMRNALESSILIDLDRKLQTINSLHAKTANLASKVKDKQMRRFIPMTAIETACKVASKLNIDPSYSIKISGILSNLQEIKQSNTPLIYQKITDDSLRKLLDLSLECDNQKEGAALLQSLGDALEKTIKANLAHKLETIDSLHALTLDLTSKVREEQSKKILPVSVMESVCKVASKLRIDPALSVKMSNILCNLLRVKQSFVLLNGNEITDGNLKLLWKVASTCEDGPEGILFFQTVGDLLENIIQADLGHKDDIINSLHTLTADLFSRIRYRKPNKALLLKNLIRNNIIVKDDVVEKLSSILTEDDLGVRSAFQHMSEENPEFIDKVLQNAASMLKYVPADERKTAHTLHRAIIKAVAETSERKVQKMLQKTESKDFYSLVDDAIGLAKALGLGDVVLMLTDILKDSKSIPILAKDPIVMEVLKRLTIMRQLAGKRPNFGYALHELKSDPYAARNDPRLRQLVRESAVLMVIPEESYVLRSSEDIPCSLFFGDNCLAVEDFMVRSRQSGSTFLILKRGVQMVVPREAARDVLTGKVPYTLLDENGIQYFKPLHVFNALNLPKVATNRFSNYGYSPKMTKPARSASSTRVPDDAMKNITNGSCSSQEAIVNKNANQMKHRLHGESSYNC